MLSIAPCVCYTTHPSCLNQNSDNPKNVRPFVTIHNVPCKTSVRITHLQTQSWTWTSTVWNKQWEYNVFGLSQQVFWVITPCRIVSLFRVAEECAASIFRVTALGSGRCWRGCITINTSLETLNSYCLGTRSIPSSAATTLTGHNPCSLPVWSAHFFHPITSSSTCD
jgi:hypothetical protein